MATKRSWEGQPRNTNNGNKPNPTTAATTSTGAMSNPAMDEPSNQVLSIFNTFRDELDEHHDRRERIIKTSRDITALSKKIIFSLQRIRQINAPLPPAIAKETSSRFAQIRELFTTLVPDVAFPGPNAWRYQRQISGGIQEYIEAVSFRHYLQTQTLISLADVKRELPAEILVTEEDYLMGLFDLTGEMMRFAVTSLSAGGGVRGIGIGQKKEKEEQQQHTHTETLPSGASIDGSAMDVDTDDATENNNPTLPSSQAAIVVDLRGMRSLFESLSVPRRHGMLKDMQKKVEVMQNSVEKVERAAYGILVRGSERPSGWIPDLSGPVEVESY